MFNHSLVLSKNPLYLLDLLLSSLSLSHALIRFIRKIPRLDSMESNSKTKTCSGCHTMKTPLWRGGPNGPKTLCNACGIKYNKKRSVMGLDRGRTEKKKKHNKKMKLRLMMEMKRSGNFGEEEQAALLLMALSCGSAYFFS